MTYAESKDRRVGSRRGRGGRDLTSIVIPHPWKLFHPLLSPSPPMPFFVTITYIQEIERFFLVLVVFIYSLIQIKTDCTKLLDTSVSLYPPFVGAEDLIS